VRADEWWIPASARAARGEVELFLDRTSVEPGGAIGVHLSAESRVRGSLWRLGALPKLVAELGEFGPSEQPPPLYDASTGLVHCSHWTQTTQVALDEGLESGVYTLRFDTLAEPGLSADAIFAVLPRAEVDVLVVLPVTTWAAYNWWGGRSLYDGGGFNGLPRADQVSFDRPMKTEVSPIWEREQGHPYFTWEHPLVAWVERGGYDVGYATSIDLHRGLLPACKLVACAGHDEYWSTEMRATLDAALGRGLSLFMAGANEICWNIRLDPSPLGEHRHVTCYKDPWKDPLLDSDPQRTTSRWSEWPLFYPESDTTGVKFVDWDFALNRQPGAWVAADTSHPLFEGTGLSQGDRVEGIVGDEWDSFDPSSTVADRVTILGEHAPLIGANLGPSTGHTVVYRTDAGGIVFASGTTSWCWGLDASSVRDRATKPDPRIQRLTKNVFDAAIEGGGV
jgi:hypothetical protein